MSDRHLPDSLVPSYLASLKTSARIGLCPTMLYLLERKGILKGVNAKSQKNKREKEVNR